MKARKFQPAHPRAARAALTEAEMLGETWRKRVAIIQRDAAERAGEGGLRQFTHSTLVGRETGQFYGRPASRAGTPIDPSRDGPIADQMQRDWILTMHYSNGVDKVIRSL